MMSSHLKFINLAHKLALNNLGKTFPNPTVGCVISKNNKIISKGATSSSGRPHAEEIALKKAGIKAKGATMYVSLEPCFHSSQNGSCADQILRSGIKEIYISCVDQDPRTKNKSISKLKRNKIRVITGIEKEKTISINNNISENFDMWSEGVKSFGLGNYLNNDLPIGKKGMIPNSEFYDRWYPDFRWGPTTNLSNSIGQGEILITPIQLANMIAAVANKGFYYTPHIIKQIQGDSIPLRFRQKNIIEIEKKYFDIIEVGLSKVYKSGTGKLLNIPGIEICGKSGTAENFTKINGKKTQLTDHSIFVAYAPKNDPQIAIAVLVENGYYGSTWAGRISSLMIEKYLKGAISNKGVEKLVINKSLDEEYKKPFSDKPFKINKL